MGSVTKTKDALITIKTLERKAIDFENEIRK
jgi:hypothetical protein